MLRIKIIEKIFMTIIKTLYAESTVNARKIVCQETTKIYNIERRQYGKRIYECNDVVIVMMNFLYKH